MENHKILPDDFNTRKYSPLDWNDGEENIRQELIVLHTKGERSYWRGQETFEERLDRKILPCARRGMHRPDQTKRTQWEPWFTKRTFLYRKVRHVPGDTGRLSLRCLYLQKEFFPIAQPYTQWIRDDSPDKNQELNNFPGATDREWFPRSQWIWYL